MAAKKTITKSATADTLYFIERREADGYLLNDADGAFAAAPADPYVSLTQHATIKGLFEQSESRVAFTDGLYTKIIYKQAGGSPSPVADTVLEIQRRLVVNDTEVIVWQPAS